MAITVHGFLVTLAERQMWLWLQRGQLKLLPSGAKRKLSVEERDFLRDHEAEFKALAAASPDKCVGWTPPPLPKASRSKGQPRTQPPLQSQPSRVPAQPGPEVYAGGVRITEAHVREAMEVAGDLHDYEAGRISKVEAYDRARIRQRQLQELYGRY